jgi:hypothetical protein
MAASVTDVASLKDDLLLKRAGAFGSERNLSERCCMANLGQGSQRCMLTAVSLTRFDSRRMMFAEVSCAENAAPDRSGAAFCHDCKKFTSWRPAG